ncbi:hypothetical protein HYN49_00715 [Flavobacterium pallidum]|uniref:DUF1735 domain-containing protein n=1 Tax=Flavobacterium pallidum TaxID=2172098 RepID=A0A2S1SDQ4_9FLAO|nr:hypothetical protein HYN49_00715 [Flavobacterium pallidum]
MFIAVFFASCGEADTAVYNGSDSDQTLLTFNSAVYKLPVKVDATGSVDVGVKVSKISDVDRVFNITVVEDATTALPAMYNVPATFTVPAGSYNGTFTITGQDVGIEPADPKLLVLELTTADENTVFDSRVSISVEQVCPVIRDEFIGTYAAVETPGPYNYTVVAQAGTQPNELVLRNIWDVDPNSTTSIFFNETDDTDTTIVYPPYLENFLYVNSQYGNAYVDDSDSALPASTVNACIGEITLNFRVRVQAGSFGASNVVLTKQ